METYLPKFYVVTGSVRRILLAENSKAAATAVINKLFEKDDVSGLGMFVYVSESGYGEEKLDGDGVLFSVADILAQIFEN